MTRIVGFSGSLRKGSYNTALLNAAKQLMPDGGALEIVSIAEFPLYNADVEEKGMPDPVEKVKNKLAEADGILVSTPEYNHSIPGVVKNAIDWLSRPAEDQAKVFHDKPFALIGATPGGFGTINSQTVWLPLMRYFKLRPCFKNSLFISKAHEKFDDDLKLIDDDLRNNLEKYLTDFVQFIHST